MKWRVSLISVLVLACTSAVHAEEGDERARTLYDQGRALFDQGEYDHCILLWREAFELSQRAGLLFNLAEAEERAGRFEDAVSSLERYLASGEAHARANRAAIARRVARLQREAQQRPAPPPLVQPAPEPQVAPNPVPPVEPHPQPEPEPQPEHEPRPRIWTWVTIGLTGLFAAAAVTTGVLTLTRTSDLEEACGGTECSPDRQSDWDTAWALAITTDVLIGLASASAVAAILCIFLENRGHRTQEATLTPWMGAGGAGLVSTFSF
jgi:tetratricopeptide (TPR) repeat protein